MNNSTVENLYNFKAVAAMSSNRVIGKNGELPWHFSEDLKFFKQLTLNSTVVMGRKTFESIGKPLPQRKNIVLSTSMQDHDGIKIFKNVEDLLCEYAGSDDDIYIIGGAQIYGALLNQTKEIYLTYIFNEYLGDAYFPEFESKYSLREIMFKNNDFEIRKYVINDPLV